MGHRNDAFQEFVLTFTSPWNLAAKTSEEWSQSFYVTGTQTHSDTDAEAAGLALAGPALALASPRTSLTKITYYPSQSLVSTFNKVYTPGSHPGTASYIATEDLCEQQLEVTAVAHCPIGTNTRGKEIYLRKYFHDVSTKTGDPNTVGDLITPATVLAPFNTGAGPHLVRPCSPSSGAAGASWVFEPHAYTHQLRKGKKRKAPTASQLTQLLHAIPGVTDIATLAKLLRTFT